MFHAIVVRPVITILRALVIATGLVTAVFAAEPVPADPVEFKIVEQPLASALTEFARQSDRELLFATDIVEGKEAQTVEGVFEPEEALTQLLADTGLKYSVTANDTILVAEGERGDRDAGNGRTAGVAQKTVMLARSQTAAPTRGSVTDEDTSADRETKRPLEEIVVTGTNIRGMVNNTAPVTILDREQIEATGLTTTARLFEALPQNFSLANQSGVNTPGVSPGKTQGVSINLRGLGEGTTLVLLNGRRVAPGFESAAADISALPLSAIDRVEVLTDGASALYGSDAIAGVVNFVLRRDFDGAETRLRYGHADGLDEYRLNQTVGNSWSGGNVVGSVEYYQRSILRPLDRSFVPSASLIGSLLPEDENISVLLSGSQSIASNLTAFTDVLHTRRDTYSIGFTAANENTSTQNSQTSATAGVDWSLGKGWQVEFSGTLARNKLDQRQASDFFGPGVTFLFDGTFETRAIALKADGALFSIPGGVVRTALGADWRSEQYRYASEFSPGFSNTPGNPEQSVRSLYAESYVPMVGEANAVAGIRRLEVSLAGRIDDYSTFGSSFDPHVGVMWEPTRGFRLRGTYGTSYKAPNLVDYTQSLNGAIAATLADPDAPGGESVQFQFFGNDVEGFRPQESESYSVGFEIAPPSLQAFTARANYYDIRYENVIANPPPRGTILAAPDSFAGLITRNPTEVEVLEAIAFANQGSGLLAFDPDFNIDPNFDPSTTDVLVDLRRRNLSGTSTRGVDLALSFALARDNNAFTLGFDGTYIIERLQQITESSLPFETVGTVSNPPKLRLRASLGWRNGGWSANGFLNYTDSYADNRNEIPLDVGSYATVDAHTSYEFRSGALEGASISISAQNLFDTDPPNMEVIDPSSDLGFDPTNASPLGRLISFELIKRW